MKNPVRKFKEEKDLTVADLAVLCDCAPATVWKNLTAENQSMNTNIVEAMEEQGYDPELVREDYQQFGKEKRAELISG